MLEKHFKRYAYFRELHGQDVESLGYFEFAIDRTIDLVNDNISLPSFSQIRVVDLIYLTLTPITVILCPISSTINLRRLKIRGAPDNAYFHGYSTWVIDWKSRFESKPSSWNDY